MHVVLYRPNLGKRPAHLISEASKKNIQPQLSTDPWKEKPEFVFRWGTSSNIPDSDKRVVVNFTKSICETSDKGAFRKKMADMNLAPRTSLSLVEFCKDPFVPVIVRPRNHQRSEDLFFCDNLSDVVARCQKYYEGGYYISEYIEKDSEYRVFVVQGRVAWVIKKLPVDKKEISWGCVSDGSFEYVAWSDWPIHVVKNAINVMSNSTLDFGAVDVIVKGDKAYMCEVNTAPYLTPYYAGCIAKTFDYMISKGSKDRIPLEDNKTWKDFIHPEVAKGA